MGAQRFGISTPGLLVVERSPEPAGGALSAAESLGASGEDAASVVGVPPAALAGRKYRLAPVDLNSATPKELEAIDGVGPALAGRIAAFRNERGGLFHSYEELLGVKGIGPATLERIRSSSALVVPEDLSQKVVLRKSTSTQADSSGLQR